MQQADSLAEWSKAPDLGSGPKGRGFKSHSCQYFVFFFHLRYQYGPYVQIIGAH